MGFFYVTVILNWGWVEIKAEVDLSLRLKWGWIEVEVRMRSSLVGADLKFSDLHWYENKKMSLISSVFISVTIWICHHLKNFQTCHRLDMKIEDFDFHTELSDGDKCHHLKVWYENFSYLSPKNAFRWWRFDRNYHRGTFIW